MPCAGEGQTEGCAAGTCQVLAVRAWCLLGIPSAKIPHENRGDAVDSALGLSISATPKTWDMFIQVRVQMARL